MVKRVSLMRVVVSSPADRRWIRRVACGLLFTGAVASTGIADDRFYVMPDGRRVRVTRSANEYGVTLRSRDDADGCARRLSAAGHGTLESFKWAPHARVKLLHTAKVSASRKSTIRQDPAIQEVRPIYRFDGSDAPAVSTGTIAAKLRPTVSDAERAQLWKDHGIVKAEPVIGQPHVYQLTPAEEEDEVLTAEALAADARLLWAQPNFRRAVDLRQVTPSDPLYRLQWHLSNTGQSGGTVGADIDAPDAWAVTGGEGIIVGTFDDSCDVDHEDLRDNYLGVGQDATLEPGAEGADDPRPKIPPNLPFDEGDAHGTRVMGLAVARSNNLGVRGVAHLAKFTVSRGLTDVVSDVEVARVFTFARQQNVDVHINSWGFFGPNPAVVVDSIDVAFKEGRNKGDLDGDGADDPLGMVILFSSGNFGLQLEPGFDLSMLPQVIGVGASSDEDVLAYYSNYGTGIDVLAPGGEFPGLIVTTDNTDYPDAINRGANVGGVNADYGLPEVDAAGKYTGFFGGTSASCPIAAGVVALMLSVNPMLTATDVRLILEHTADRISPEDAQYNTITSRSLKYGYGRIRAGGARDKKVGAVDAAQQTLSNGGKTWPDRPGKLVIEGPAIRWTQNIGTDEYLVVESESPFDFIPQDGECYGISQTGCGAAALHALPAGVHVLATGCNLTCAESEVPGCTPGAAQCVPYPMPTAGKKLFFGIYARSSIGRYSYGVAADSDGTVTDSGDVVGAGGSGGSTPPPGGPSVTLSVSPLEGTSPLTVRFNGNAVSEVPIDESRTAWDFDVDDTVTTPDATTRTATHTYIVEAGLTRTFVARLTMYNADGHSGSGEVAIRVQGGVADNSNDNVGEGVVKIVVGVPGTPGSDLAEGTSPFSVVLSINSTGLPGTLQSVVWDLGDGTRATSLEVPHTYDNTSTVALRIPVTATVTTVTSGATTVSTTATRIITVQPGIPSTNPGVPDLPGTHPGGAGGAATPCGGVGMIPLLLSLTSFLWLRRRS